MSVSGPRNGPDLWATFLGPEIVIMGQFLGPEIVIMGQQNCWAQKLTLWVSFWAQKLTLWARDTLWRKGKSGQSGKIPTILTSLNLTKFPHIHEAYLKHT